MKGTLAFLLISLGAVGAALAVARTDPSAPGWVSAFQVHVGGALLSLAVLAAGILVRRSAVRDAARAEARSGASLAACREALGRIAEETAALEGGLACGDLAALHERLEDIVSGPVADFVENRQALLEAHGIRAYGAVMSPFAQGERYLNRAWSASADGYGEECAEFVRRAGPLLREAREALPG